MELERFAARETQRLLYLRTGQTVPARFARKRLPNTAHGVLLGCLSHERVRSLLPEADQACLASTPDAFCLLTTLRADRHLTVIAGKEANGVLYGVYRFGEHLGFGYGMEGEAVPDTDGHFCIPRLDEISVPRFSLRGVLPFHNFPEGPDWWNLDDYCAVLAQFPSWV